MGVLSSCSSLLLPELNHILMIWIPAKTAQDAWDLGMSICRYYCPPIVQYRCTLYFTACLLGKPAGLFLAEDFVMGQELVSERIASSSSHPLNVWQQVRLAYSRTEFTGIEGLNFWKLERCSFASLSDIAFCETTDCSGARLVLET